MKRAYVRPTMVGERFVANEYVAACGDSGKVYKFECNAGDGVPGNVYQETNGESGLQRWPSKPGSKPDTNLTSGLLTSYHACGETHEASAMDNFVNGYYVSLQSGKVTNVIIWRGKDGHNVHCTTQLKMDEWATAKS